MKSRLDQCARNFYGDKDYTIAEGILSGKGKLVVRNNLSTNWKNEDLYQEGLLAMSVDGREAKKFAKENNITIGKE